MGLLRIGFEEPDRGVMSMIGTPQQREDGDDHDDHDDHDEEEGRSV